MARPDIDALAEQIASPETSPERMKEIAEILAAEAKRLQRIVELRDGKDQ